MNRLSRDFTIKGRKENTKEDREVKIYYHSLKNIFKEFKQNITLIKNKFDIVEQLQDNGSQSVAKDIYRFQIVFLEGALDYFLHRLGMYAMRQMYEGKWDKSASYPNIKVPINDVLYVIEHPKKTKWLDNAIMSYHSSKTYMSPNKIRELLILIGKNYFDEIAMELYPNDKSPKDKLEAILKEIFDRRNKIVHQLDCNHKTGLLTDIQKEDVEKYITVVEQFVEKLYNKICN